MIEVIGWYNRHNIGDESYKLAFPILFPGAPLEFRDVPSKDASTVVLGGGHILSKSFLEALAKCPAQRKLALSVSVDANTPSELLKQFETIYARDLNSVNLIQSWGIQAKFMPDISTCLVPNPENGMKFLSERFGAEKLDLYQRRVVVALNAHVLYRDPLLARDYLTCMKAVQDIARVADETSASFIFIPFSTGQPYDDRVINGLVNAHCKWWQKNLVIHDRLDVQQTLDILAACNLIISSRLHSSIFGTISHVPYINLIHHDKMSNYAETIGWKDNLSYWSFCSHDLLEMVKTHLDNEAANRARLETIHQEQLALLMKEIQDVRLSE